ncbi:MAG: GNAT family acetyltransferase [Oribacterium sp.]|nr:GNAT family acetyltransferase [Oribacterium sp.]
MEKLLIMCEGPNEREIINILLNHGYLKFTEDDLLGLTPYHARQIKTSAQVRTELNIYPGTVKVLRIGDKQSDKITIPSEYKDKITGIEKYCTKPELEMLFIIAEGLEKEYEKSKSNTKPKDFAKKHITFGKKKYDNSTSFYTEYFGNNPELLVNCIKKYHSYNGSHDKDEHYLDELLK